MNKRNFYSELAYMIAVVGLALGTAFMEKSNFGVSMIVAPAYLIYLKMSQIWSFITFGITEYLIQACLLIAMCILLRKFKVSYLFSFVTAIFYGFFLDKFIALIALVDAATIPWRVFFYVAGVLICAISVAFFLHTYIPSAVYDFFVKEVSANYNIKFDKFKTIFDCTCCLTGIILSFIFFGLFKFEGVKIGTIVCAVINGKLIGMFSRWMDKQFEFKDALRFRKHFSSTAEISGTPAEINN